MARTDVKQVTVVKNQPQGRFIHIKQVFVRRDQHRYLRERCFSQNQSVIVFRVR